MIDRDLIEARFGMSVDGIPPGVETQVRCATIYDNEAGVESEFFRVGVFEHVNRGCAESLADVVLFVEGLDHGDERSTDEYVDI